MRNSISVSYTIMGKVSNKIMKKQPGGMKKQCILITLFGKLNANRYQS